MCLIYTSFCIPLLVNEENELLDSSESHHYNHNIYYSTPIPGPKQWGKH